MTMLKNVRHEAFCQSIAVGKPYVEAYATAGYKTVKKAAAANATRLMQRPDVIARIDELKKETAATSRMTREQLRDYFIDVLLTPAGDIDGKHRLCQSVKITEDYTEHKLPDKLKAASELIRICGWAEPEELKISAGAGMLEVIKKIRK